MGQQDMAALRRASVPQEFQESFRVDGLTPLITLGLKPVGRQLNEQNPRLSVARQIVIQGQIMSDGQNGVCHGYVAGFEAGIPFDNSWVDTGHCGGIAVNEYIAVSIPHVEDCVI
jgi:hypothetical protein